VEDIQAQESSKDELISDAEGLNAMGESDDPTTMRTRYVNIRMDLSPDADQPLSAQGDSYDIPGLNLFSDLTVNAVIDHIEENLPGMISWVCSLEGIPGGQASW
jgi:hypothetical protein